MLMGWLMVLAGVFSFLALLCVGIALRRLGDINEALFRASNDLCRFSTLLFEIEKKLGAVEYKLMNMKDDQDKAGPP